MLAAILRLVIEVFIVTEDLRFWEKFALKNKNRFNQSASRFCLF